MVLIKSRVINSNGIFLIKKEEEMKNEVKIILKKKQKMPIFKIINQMYDNGKISEDFKRNDIERILKEMIRKKMIIVAPELTKQDIFVSITKRNILSYINNNPGNTIEDLFENIGIKKSKLIWHLTILEKYQYIKSLKSNRKKAYYIDNHTTGGMN